MIILIKVNVISLQKAFHIKIFKIISKIIMIKKNVEKNIKIFILYDSFIFNII